MAGGRVRDGFLVPFVFADQLGVQRDAYYAIYVGAVLALCLGWVWDTGQSLRALFARRWRLAIGLGVAFGALTVAVVLGQEEATPRPGGLTLVGAIIWRGVVYGSADGLLLTAFPILVVFAALANSRLRRRRGGVVAVGALAVFAVLVMTATYHLGYSDFRSSKLRKPLTGDVLWTPPTLFTLNPVGAPIVHVAAHVTAVIHSYNTKVFLPPH